MRRPEHRCCQRCGALLRAANRGTHCDPCRRSRPPAPPALPADFYHRAVVVQALRRYDFGTFFKAVRHELKLSQEAFGLVVVPRRPVVFSSRLLKKGDCSAMGDFLNREWR